MRTASPVAIRGVGTPSHSRQASFSKPAPLGRNPNVDEEDEVAESLGMGDPDRKKEEQRLDQLAHLEQLRMLILGMEQRLEVREEKLTKVVEKAQIEGKKYEAAVASAGV